MQRPDVRSTNRDNPTHPSMPSSADIALSRICAIPASMDEGYIMANNTFRTAGADNAAATPGRGSPAGHVAEVVVYADDIW
jgi:hypothetical protein